MSTAGVFFAEHVSDRAHYSFGTFVTSFLYSAGGGWVALLGYLLLDLVGWRVFVLFSSIPLFVPPILILHCCIKGENRNSGTEQPLIGFQGGEEKPSESRETIHVENIASRITKASLFTFINVFQGYGSILLLPALMRYENEKRCETLIENQEGPCSSVVDGYQFLILALVTGAGNLLGRGVGYLFTRKITFRILQPTLALILSIGYLLLLFKDKSYILVVCSMGWCKIVYSMMRIETTLIQYDLAFFGTENIAKASAIVTGSGMFGSAIANGCAAFLNPSITVQITFVLSLVLIGVVCSITERNSRD